MKNRINRTLAIAFVALLTTGCESIPLSLETPGVTVTSFRALPGSSLAPQFEIGLKIDNPNPIPLSINGISYAVSLEGESVVTGLTQEVSPIERYGSGEVTITAAPDLASTVRVITGLLGGRKDSVNYALEAELDVGRFLPAIKVSDAGVVSLSNL